MIGSFDKTNLETLPEGMSLVEHGHILGDWFVFRENRHFGPLSSQEVRGLLTQKLLSTDHHIWRPGFDGWRPIKDVEGFKSYGKTKVKSYTDEEFSYKGKLGYIDRITKEASSLDFAEGNKPRTREEIEADIREKEKIPVGNSMVAGVMNYFGFNGTYVNFGRIMASLIIIAVIGAVVYKNMETKEFRALNGLPEEISIKLLQASAGSDNARNPEFKVFEQKQGVPNPVLIFGTDLPIGTRLAVEVVGVEGSLLGTYRFEQSTEILMKEKIFRIPPIRENSGRYISPGLYAVKVTCIDCVETNKVVFDQTYTFGVEDQALYQGKLKTYQQSVREDLRSELDELEDLSFTLFTQYKTSADKFKTYSRAGRVSAWEGFAPEWLNRQNKLIDLFQQMKTDDFKAKLFYLSFYQAYEDVITRIFELHLLQDSSILKVAGGDRDKVSMRVLTKEIDQRLTIIKAQLKLARIDFNKANGMPSAPKLEL